jgi:hypothetical protein
MKLTTLLALGALAVGFGLSAPQANATVCPGTSASGGDCNLFVTFNSDGSISTSGPGGTYDGVEDSLIGVINNSGHSLFNFNISDTQNIFGDMETGLSGDGISSSSYVGAQYSQINGYDNTYYAGPDNYFTILTPNSGIVNFINDSTYHGLLTGTTSYFSLEYGIDISAPPVITTGVPEPATFAIMGAGLIGIALARRRRRTV